jgi:tagatose 1,6-diphosphate aldolase
MKNISVGKIYGLQHISCDRGTFTCLALDHRQNLRKALHPENPSATTDQQLSRFKLDVTTELAPMATAVLLDPEVSAAQAIAARSIPNHVGLVVALESTGYSGDPAARMAQIIPGWSVEKVKRMGAAAIKLLVYYHPDSPASQEIEFFVRNISNECKKFDIAMMLEPLSYSLDDSKKLSSEEKHDVVVETARRLSSLGIDVLKAEFPLDVAEKDETLWAKACADVSAASEVPWILLSAAVDFETYLRQVTVACNQGASGIAVGRAVWQETVPMNFDDRVKFLGRVGRSRLERLASLCHALARPWTDFYACETDFNWYKNY